MSQEIQFNGRQLAIPEEPITVHDQFPGNLRLSVLLRLQPPHCSPSTGVLTSQIILTVYGTLGESGAAMAVGTQAAPPGAQSWHKYADFPLPRTLEDAHMLMHEALQRLLPGYELGELPQGVAAAPGPAVQPDQPPEAADLEPGWVSAVSDTAAIRSETPMTLVLLAAVVVAFVCIVLVR